MTWRTAVAAMCGLVVMGSVALADVCPLCLQSIPEGEKLCSRHKKEQVAKTISSADEKRLVDELVRARAAYQAKLQQVEGFYKERGDAINMRKAATEREDFANVRAINQVPWEKSLGELSAATEVAEADALLKQANDLRRKMSPFGRGERTVDAARLYQDILIKHPTSTAVEPAAYALGDIHAGRSVREYDRAAYFFELCYLANPKTSTDALFRAARLYDEELTDYETAARFYWMAGNTSSSAYVRKYSATRLKAIQSVGFGAAYSLDEKEAPKTATP